jgi:cytochrome c553
MSLTEQEILKLADYYAANRRWEPCVPDPVLREQGARLATAGACMACHGQRLMGQGPFPRLAGQGADYLLAQLDAFAQGRRVDPTGSMKAITATLSAQDRKALAHYLASLAPAPK